MQNVTGRIHDTIDAIPEREWTACFADEAEGWRYYRACADAMTAFAELRDDKGLLVAAPLFRLSYRLDTPFQGKLSALGAALTRAFPRLMEWKLLGIGSPYADRCHIALRMGLNAKEREEALRQLMKLLETEAERMGAVLTACKDLQGGEYDWMKELLPASGYVSINSLPVAALSVPEGGRDVYLQSLSSATRKDIRRKLKGAQVTIEHRTDLDGIEDEIAALYESTKTNSSVRYGDFEELPKNYFRNVSRELGEQALFILYRVEGQLAAFNLLLLERDRVIDKFLGMRYPLAREHNLYVVSWMENLRFCQETGRRLLQTGQTAYASKVRFGSSLIPSYLFARHRNRLLNALIRLSAPLMAFDRWDPELRKLRVEKAAR